MIISFKLIAAGEKVNDIHSKKVDSLTPRFNSLVLRTPKEEQVPSGTQED